MFLPVRPGGLVFQGMASPPVSNSEVIMAKTTDKELTARVTALEVEIEILKTGLGELGAELAAASRVPAPLPAPAVDLAATNDTLRAILARLDRPIVMKKQFHD
jgi:hypothetical protein